jgi:hypothetical protein
LNLAPEPTRPEVEDDLCGIGKVRTVGIYHLQRRVDIDGHVMQLQSGAIWRTLLKALKKSAAEDGFEVTSEGSDSIRISIEARQFWDGTKRKWVEAGGSEATHLLLRIEAPVQKVGK